jgi:hypothetical protein
MKRKTIKLLVLSAALIMGATRVALAQAASGEEDTNLTTVAYWKFNGLSPIPENPVTGVGFLDLATNVGQGTVPGSGVVPPSVQNLWMLGPISGNPTFSSAVPPTGMFNPNNYFNAGPASWDCGADEYSGAGGEVDCDDVAYGTNFDTPSFTEEVIFQTDYSGSSNPSLGTTKQTLIWNHQNSAYGEIQLNELSNGTNTDEGSLLFWSWNVVQNPFVRITAAQNGGERFDDGQWHYVCCRYNGQTLTMDILIVNQDGTWQESSTYIAYPLNPGSSSSQGPFIIGNDENGSTPFDGLINQVRFSNVALPDNELLANVSGCIPTVSLPPSALSPTTNTVALGSALNLTPVNWFNNGFPEGNQIEGGPLQYQWQLNGTNLLGQTNLNLNLYPATFANAGAYQLIASTPCDLSVTSAPVVVSAVQAIPTALWNFNFTEDTTFPQATVDDAAPNYINIYDLITFNNQPNSSGIGSNGEIPLTNTAPPITMLINTNNIGTNSFDASYLAGQDGVVFYPNGSGPGDPFDFTTSFSLELFFMTYGNESTNGAMELICQGTDSGETFSYGINLNQSAPGGLSFKINNHAIPPVNTTYAYEDTNAGIQSIVLTNANYADGNWHYALAEYDSAANTITLAVGNTDGSGTNVTQTLPAGYSPLAYVNEGNLFVGRMHYAWNPDGQEGQPSDDPRNFTGAIADVQVSDGLITPASGQLGFLPGTAIITPAITGISVSGQTVTINFTGNSTENASAFTLIGSSTVNGTYSALSANITALGSGSFQATIPMSGKSEFYKIEQ